MANYNKKSSPAGIIFALLMLIVIVIALVIVLRSCSAGGETAGSASPDAGTVTTGALESAVPPTGTPADRPSDTPEPPSSPSPTPSPTPSPSPSPTPPASASGSISSDTGTSLNIVADWTLSGSTLTVEVSAESYRLQSVGAPNAGWVSVNGVEHFFNTQEINYEGPEQGRSPLGSVTIEGVSAPAQIEVVWLFRGSYGGVELERISASGSIG